MNGVKNFVIILGLLAVLGVAGSSAFKIYSDQQQKAFDKQQKVVNDKIAILQRQISELQQKLQLVTGQQEKIAIPPHEAVKREEVRQKSQDELLTGAVAKAAPAVVSVVISKDVPQLEVVYQNPFGDDPFFKDFGFRIPVYRQKGLERKKVGAGSGFLITSDGYIVTNKHVVLDDQASYTALLADGNQQPAKVIFKDPQNDIAIMKIDGKSYSVVSIGDSSALKLGQTVVAIGNALGEYNNSVAVGIVSGLDRNIQASGQGQTQQLNGVIQTDAAINPGNSGGPLLNLDGKIIGVNVATIIGSNNISFAIPINVVKGIIKTVVGR